MKKEYTAEQYNQYVEQKAPKSRIVRDTVVAFLVGGLICLIAQCISSFLKFRNLDEFTVTNALPVIMIAIGAFLTGIGVYSKLGKFAGAGSFVPITGFANSIVSPAMEFKSEGMIFGLAAKMFTIAGPVIVYGTITSVIVGLGHFLFG